MTVQLSLSSCSRYMVYRPLDIAQTSADLKRRCKAARDFARERDTNRIVYDLREMAFGGDSQHFETFLSYRASLTNGQWIMAWVSSLKVPTHSSDFVAGLADLFNVFGQNARFFMDYEQALAWLTAEPGKAGGAVSPA